MERKSKADIKKALENLKNPKGPGDKGAAIVGKKQSGKASGSASMGKTYRPKI